MKPASDLPLSIDPILIDRYLAGECTAVEQQYVEQWAAADPQHLRRLARTRLIREKAKGLDEPISASAVWPSLLARATRPVISTNVRLASERLPEVSAGRRLWPIAAMVLGMTAALVLMVARIHTGHRSGAVVEYATGIAERKAVRLADGTQVMLAPASRIRIARDYGVRSRAIALEGEAYFTVVHNSARPLSITTSQAVVRDIGTAFDLKAYAEDLGARVSVTAGEVSVTANRCASGLVPTTCNRTARPNDIVFADNTGVSVRHVSDVDPYVAWMQGRLVFDDTPLAGVVHDLERDFGLRITIADSAIGHKHVSGDFNNVPVDQVLDEITRTVGATFERHGRSVTISRRPATPVRQDSKSPVPLATALSK